jgi:translation elongation factor EF-1beta
MSGQTIGVWNNKFNEKLAKWGFKYVDIITVRDEEFSLESIEDFLLSISGISGKIEVEELSALVGTKVSISDIMLLK